MYLIAHKVRGKRAFDIAEPMDINGETWWIIPTSGHRAYPYWNYLINPLTIAPASEIPMPDDLPDHYPAMVKAKHEPVIIDLEELDL